MKNCQNCNKEFKDLHETRGESQKYCSVKCRQRSAYQRMKQRLIQEALNEQKNIITDNVQIEQEIKIMKDMSHQEKNIITDNVEIEQEIKIMKDMSDQEKRSGINRFIHWFMESDEKLTAETILNVAKCFSWEEKFFYDFMNTWKPANPIKKTK